MKKLIFLFISIFLYGANLINIDYFSHKNFVDVLLSLDSKFDGKVIKLSKNKYYIKNVHTTNDYIKEFNLDYLKKVEVYPYKEGIVLKIDGDFVSSFDLTPEGYGIRVRIKSKKVKQDLVNNLMANNPEKTIDYYTYFIILAILIILAIILIVVRRKVSQLPIKKSNLNMVVLMQKPIDAKNRVVLFEFNKRKYLMLVGNSNILLDVFDEEMINISTQKSTQKEFDEFLKINNKMDEIKNYIKNAEQLKGIDERV